MAPKLMLYGFGPTRSARCRWTLLELGLPFEERDDRALVGSDELRALHPQAKLPALSVDGRALFESAAICTYLADIEGNNTLISPAGSWERALHDQWVSFVLTEMEAWLWSSMKHKSFYAEADRVPAVLPANEREFHNGATSLNQALADCDFLVNKQFSVTDIIVGWTVNWGRRQGLLEPYDNLKAYLERLFARELCTLNPE